MFVALSNLTFACFFLFLALKLSWEASKQKESRRAEANPQGGLIMESFTSLLQPSLAQWPAQRDTADP